MARHSLKVWDARVKENILAVIMYAACDHEKTDDYEDVEIPRRSKGQSKDDIRGTKGRRN